MPIYLVDDMDGPLLDAAVAECECRAFVPDSLVRAMSWRFNADRTGVILTLQWGDDPESLSHNSYSPTTDRNKGWEIAERERIGVLPPEQPAHFHGGPNAGHGQAGVWAAASWKLRGADGRRRAAWHETNPLVAAMRLLVKCRLGDWVEL